MRFNHWVLGLGVMFMYACGGEDAGSDDKAEDVKPVVCSYSFIADSTKVTWTAFKTSAKVGVPGTFNTIKFKTIPSLDPADVLTSASFVADKGTPNTDNPVRDTTLTENFFNLLEGDGISGKVISAVDGNGVIEVSINNVSKEYDFTYSLTDLQYKIQFDINLDSLGADAALDGIHEACGLLHKGEDGISALSPIVSIEVVSTLQEDCK
ncbi:MAG: hypothetical protein HRT71_21320 [Flavobacteriales bacterium]|nr:hypothetical protein [Flavobacteriales bacterium]